MKARMFLPVVLCAGAMSLPAMAGQPMGKAYVGGKLLKQALAGPLKDVKEIVFAIRVPGNSGHYYMACSSIPGGGLYKLDVRSGKLTVLLHAGPGAVRDPKLHYDGKKIVFARCTGAPDDLRSPGKHPLETAYHLYEINDDGSGLKQLTDGHYHDVEPCYLPDGGIVFCSSRCKRVVGCITNVETLILYRCDADGKNIRPLPSSPFLENSPSVLADGRVIFTRWEYLDRSSTEYHHLWTVNPDGTGVMTFFGKTRPGGTFTDARAIPGHPNLVVASFCGHGSQEREGTIRWSSGPARGSRSPHRRWT